MNIALKNMVTKSITKKELLPIWIILCVIILVDMFSRFTPADIAADNEWNSKVNNSQSNIGLSQQHAEHITAIISAFEASTGLAGGNSSEIGIMSQAAQLAQEGDLNEFFSGNLRYRLVGIFNQNRRFAIVSQENLLNNEQVLLNVEVLDEVNKYQIKHILSDKVIFTRNDKQISLFLYRTVTNSSVTPPSTTKNN